MRWAADCADPSRGHQDIRQFDFYVQRVPGEVTFAFVLLLYLALPSELPGYLCGYLRVRFRTYLAALSLAELPYAVGAVVLSAGAVHRQIGLLVTFGLIGAALSLYAVRMLHRRLDQEPFFKHSRSTGVVELLAQHLGCDQYRSPRRHVKARLVRCPVQTGGESVGQDAIFVDDRAAQPDVATDADLGQQDQSSMTDPLSTVTSVNSRERMTDAPLKMQPLETSHRASGRGDRRFRRRTWPAASALRACGSATVRRTY